MAYSFYTFNIARFVLAYKDRYSVFCSERSTIYALVGI